jgi:hypothetical protein
MPMAHQVVRGYISDSSEFVQVIDDDSAVQSGEGSNCTVSLSMSTYSNWATSISRPPASCDSESEDLATSKSTAFYQCQDEDILVECLSCGSFFELGTFCPGC